MTDRLLELLPDSPFVLHEEGEGRPILVLHGGGGPFTVQSIVSHLAPSHHVLAPTHPGWDGTARPAWSDSIEDLAIAYLHLLADLDLTGVAVIGSSMGGWIAAEMAVRDEARRISDIVLIDGVGVDVPGQPIRDFFALDPKGVATYAWHDSERYYVDPATVPPAQAERQKGNMEALRAYAGIEMHDPKLLRRLGGVRARTLAIWGASDGIVTPDYGRAFAAAVPGGQFELIEEAGHLPHIEQPAATWTVLDPQLG
jgi:pimeloyl-ACP methyl ester carboxylesterase